MKTLTNVLLIVLLVTVGSASAQKETGKDLIDLGQALLFDGDYEGAVELFSQAVAQEPDNAEYLSHRAVAYQASRDLDAAAADCNRAMELDPEAALAHICSSRLYLDNEYEGFDVAQAVAEANRGVELAPESWLAHFNLGVILAPTGSHARALEAFDRAIELGMPYPAVYDAAGSVSGFAMRDPETALAYFDAGLEAHPDSALLFHKRGVINMRLENYEASLADLERSRELDPDYAPAYLDSGLVNSILGDMDAAIAGYLGWLERIEEERIQQEAIAFGEAITLQMQSGRVYAIPVEVEADAVISITADALTRVDPLIFLFDEEGEFLAYNDDIVLTGEGRSLDAALNDLTLTTGTYTLLVTHAGSGSEGRIRVLVESGG